MGGSSKKQTVGYKYYLGEHMILIHGPADSLEWIKVDNKVAFTGPVQSGQIYINKPELFGGEKREGGVVGYVDVEMGEPTQGRNSYLQARLGSSIPAFRGVVGVVLRQVYLGVNPYLKRWAFRLKRIHKREDGLTQWYDPRAEIPNDLTFGIPAEAVWDYQILPGVIPTSNQTEIDAIEIPSSGWTPNGVSPFGRESTGGSLDPIYPINTFWGYNTSLWLQKYIVTPDDGIINIQGHVENGALFYFDGVLFDSVNLDNSQSATASGIPYSVTVPSNLATPGQHRLNILVLDEDDDNPDADEEDNTYFYGLISAGEYTVGGDMNPAHIIRECLTNPDWGMGYQDADIDDVSFMAAADTLYNEAMGISLLWDRQNTIESFVQEITKHIDAALYVDRITGKFTLKLIRYDYDENNLLEFDESNISQIQNLSRANFGELVNSVTVNYWDSATGETASLTVQDTALALMQEATINTTVQYPGFTNGEIAARVAARDLRALSLPLWSCTIYTDKTADELNIGDVFKMSWADYGISSLIMRVTGMAFGNGKSNKIKLICTQDVFALPDTGVISAPAPDDGWVPIDGEPTPIPFRVVTEAPYYELTTILGQSDADSRLSQIPELGFLLATGSRPTVESAINASLYVNDGSGYEDSGVLDFSPLGYLDGAITKGQTVIPIKNLEDIELIELGTHAQIGNELVRIDAISASSMTVGRGVLDTVPAEHGDNSEVLFWDQYPVSDEVEYVSGESVDVKLLTVTGQGILAEADAPVDSVTFDQRALRPYPPGNVKINTLYFPDAIAASADLALTWAHRDRLQQTSGALEDFTYGDIGPEAGTEYVVNIYDENDALLNTETLSTTSKTYPAATELSDFATQVQAPSGIFEVVGSGSVPASNLVALYKCDTNVGGVLEDDSGNNNDGSIQGGTIVTGVIGNALQFNGSTSQGASTTHFANLSGGWCISLWLNVTWRDNQYDCIFMQDDGSQHLRFFNYSTTTQNQGLLLNYDGTNLNNIPGVRPSGLTHVLAQYNSTTGLLELYFDNTLIDSATVSTGLSTPNLTALIGKAPSNYTDPNETIVGWVDHIRLYNKTMNSGERAALANEPYAVTIEDRLSSKLLVEISSLRDTLASLQKHEITVDRYGYGYNYGKYYGGQ